MALRPSSLWLRWRRARAAIFRRALLLAPSAELAHQLRELLATGPVAEAVLAL